jgi:hypothetical protein
VAKDSSGYRSTAYPVSVISVVNKCCTAQINSLEYLKDYEGAGASIDFSKNDSGESCDSME